MFGTLCNAISARTLRRSYSHCILGKTDTFTCHRISSTGHMQTRSKKKRNTDAKQTHTVKRTTMSHQLQTTLLGPRANKNNATIRGSRKSLSECRRPSHWIPEQPRSLPSTHFLEIPFGISACFCCSIPMLHTCSSPWCHCVRLSTHQHLSTTLTIEQLDPFHKSNCSCALLVCAFFFGEPL